MNEPRRIKATGPKVADLAFVGEAGGETEARRGRAFCGKTGQLFDSLLWAEGIVRDRCYVDNIYPFWTGPGNPDPPLDGVLHWGTRLLEHLRDIVQPKVLVTLGRVSTRFFLGDVDMEAVHGLRLRGRGFNIVPAYHPAAGLHNAEMMQLTAYDFTQVKMALRYGQFRDLEDEHPDPEYREWDEELIPPGTIYIDTEGVPGSPWCLTFTTKPGYGYLIRATDRGLLRKFARKIRGRHVMFHNAMWDLEMLREMGVEVDPNSIGDTMVKAFNLRVEPQGLKALAFRHAGMVMQDFMDLVAPYDDDIMEGFLLDVVADPRSQVKPDPVLDETTGKVRQPQSLYRRVWNLLKKDGGTRKGWDAIEPEVRGEFEAPPFSLDNVPIDEMINYACRDADATLRVDRALNPMMKALEVTDPYELDMAALPLFERMQANGMPFSIERSDHIFATLSQEMAEIRDRIAEVAGTPVNPDSGLQVAELLFGKLGLESKRMTKKRTRLATDDKALEALRGKHRVVGLITDYRERSKLCQFTKLLPKHQGSDGRIRGKIRVTRVVTGRPSMTEPNLLAIPTRTELGRKIRWCFEAPEGRLLGTADLDQVEMRVMADYSRDERLVELFNSGRDIHAQTASDMFGVPLDKVDPMLHRYPAKRVGFGVITGIQEEGLLDQMYLAGITAYSQSDCGQMIKDWFSIYPGVKKFMHECRVEAQRQGYVRDRAGRIRYLPAVRAPWEWVKEEALRQSHSHKIQGTAAWLIKRAMKRLWDLYRKDPFFEPLLQIYDEIITEFPVKREKEVAKLLPAVLTADSPMFCVPIKAKFASGPDWGSLEK